MWSTEDYVFLEGKIPRTPQGNEDMKELKTLQESSKIMGGVGAIAIVISFFELADGLSYAKIMLTLVSFLLLCFSVQTYFSYTRNTQGLATKE